MGIVRFGDTKWFVSFPMRKDLDDLVTDINNRTLSPSFRQEMLHVVYQLPSVVSLEILHRTTSDPQIGFTAVNLLRDLSPNF